MDTRYDTTKWKSETSLGRTSFIYNYGMRGNEFTGRELIKTVITDHEVGVREKIYL
jgi:hypothetical protein